MKSVFTSDDYLDYGDIENEIKSRIGQLHRYHVKHGLAWPPEFLVRQIARDLSTMPIEYTDEPRPPRQNLGNLLRPVKELPDNPLTMV
jgi:hypothetical protein